ncbi:hypothetical protein MA9V2_241 [Chryseobacterium phage MA9V-2]|nr:hypothetical protein MA9V2_241 [Chryseobacterium phage MA9V-2]
MAFDFKDILYDRVRFETPGIPGNVVIEDGLVRQTQMPDGDIDNLFKYIYIYAGDGTPRKLLATSIASVYYTDGKLSSNRIIDTNGFTFAISGLTKQTTNLSNYTVMLQDANSNTHVADADNFINNVYTETDW